MKYSNLQYYLKCISEGREPGDKWEPGRQRRRMEAVYKEWYKEQHEFYKTLWGGKAPVKAMPEAPVMPPLSKPEPKPVVPAPRRKRPVLIVQDRAHKNAVARAWYQRLKEAGEKPKKNFFPSKILVEACVNHDSAMREREKSRNAKLMALAAKREHNRLQREYERSLCPIHWVQKRPYSNGTGKIKHKCPVCESERKKDWRFTIKGRESKRISKLLRKHRERAGGELTRDILYRVFQNADNACECCGSRVDLTLDHKLAIARGGTNDMANLGVLCRTCNSSKGARCISYEELREWLGICA
jgi:hypothetical protein